MYCLLSLANAQHRQNAFMQNKFLSNFRVKSTITKIVENNIDEYTYNISNGLHFV